MSLEKKAENLIEALTTFINSVNALVSGGTSGAINDKAPAAKSPAKDKAPTKKELAELKKSAKTLASKVMQDLGKAGLGKLLDHFDAAKFSDVKDDADEYRQFMTIADRMLTLAADTDSAPAEDEDLLGDGVTEDVKEYTVEDVKVLLLKVNSSPKLGRDVTRQILADLGVTRLPELKKEKYAQAVLQITSTLDDAGVK